MDLAPFAGADPPEPDPGMATNGRTMRILGVAVALSTAGTAHTQPLERGLILPSASAALEASMTPIENLSIRVDLSERTFSLLSGDSVVRRYPAAIGTPGYATPTGTFRIQRLIWNPSWTPPASAWARDRRPARPGEPGNPMGSVKIFFREPDYYIHGTPQPSSLGQAASHGCVRLRDADAAEVARYVMMAAGADRDAAWFRRVATDRTTSRTVSLPRAVTVRIVP
jgi:lipoprotein-anchoring transpeptidase ErfK/SrfK